MEAPWVKGEPLAQEMGDPMVLTLAQAEATGQLQKVACMAPMAGHSGLASLETWITTSWPCGCQRACSVKVCYKGWPTLSRVHQAHLGPKALLASARSSLPTAT